MKKKTLISWVQLMLFLLVGLVAAKQGHTQEVLRYSTSAQLCGSPRKKYGGIEKFFTVGPQTVRYTL